MIDFEQLLNKVVGGDDGFERTVPGAAALVADGEGKVLYSKAAGLTSVDPNIAKPMETDTVCFSASMTKLVTSISVMQCVERGLISLDDDIYRVLPEWKDAEILEGFEEESGKPILRKALNKITLRQLLTHTSGMGYDTVDPNLIRLRKYRGENPQTMSSTVEEGLFLPLGFEPGEGWKYGASIDWVGRLVERLNGDVRLGVYFQKNIFEPLGIASTTFDVTTRPDLEPRLAGMTTRTVSGDLVPHPSPLIPSPPVDHCGGVGLYSTAEDYIKLLTALLTKDMRILKPESVDAMFTPQLKGDGEHLMKVLEDPAGDILAKVFPVRVKATYGLGGMLNLEDMPTGRRAGAMQWGGLPNLFWWIDPAAGVCGTLFAQVVPPGDDEVVKLFAELERSTYQMLGAAA